MAWVSLSRACFAEPPAESPSTKNSSPCMASWQEQSANLPGRAGPDVTFLRATFFPARKRAWALFIASSAMSSASATC